MNRLIQLHCSHFPSAYPQDDPEKLAAALLDACGKIEVSLLKTELPGQNGQMFDVLQIHDWWDGLLLPVTINERSEEHTSELQPLMRISYAVFCLKKKKKQYNKHIEDRQ